MAVPGTGSTNQSLTFAAAKKLAGKAHTSNLREIYNETIPSNVQLDTSTLFGEAIPQTVSTSTLYARFSASVNDPVTVEYVEFYIEDISGTTYNANTGSFGDVGFGGGDETQDPGAHGYQLRLTSSYQTLSSNALKGTGFFVNNQTVHESNGGLQLVMDFKFIQATQIMEVCRSQQHRQLNGQSTTSMVQFLFKIFCLLLNLGTPEGLFILEKMRRL